MFWSCGEESKRGLDEEMHVYGGGGARPRKTWLGVVMHSSDYLRFPLEQYTTYRLMCKCSVACINFSKSGFNYFKTRVFATCAN